MYIILGKNGYIAQAIIAECKKRGLHYLALSRSDVDYTDFKEFSNYAHINYNNHEKPFKDSVIINCAGYIGRPNVDACEKNKGDTIMGNIVFPTNLANFCTTNYSTLVQISSGCIYNGYEKHFTEEDEPNFTFDNGSFYSGTKALCEKMILKHNPRSYIFRLRIPFDERPSPRNYLTKLLTYDNLIDVENSFSHRGDFAQYCMDLLEQKAPHGIYNITNKGSATTKRVVELMKRHLKIPNKQFSFFEDYNSFSSEIVAPRSNCVLDTTKLEKYVKIRSIEDALSDSLSRYAISETSQSAD
jgi:UDP-glucose 4,6-dehydratase|tara:strand:- start:9001 stop:9900 length:900 start_codon:yes stop_codon:yes gene_type:complete